MSKRFKGKACVYCGTEGAAQTGDHVLAREFVPVHHRPQIRQVPACVACNKEKADLEHYLTAVLPFGGRHAEASGNLTANAPRRLAKNKKLHRELAAGSSRIWAKEPSGILVNSLAVPIDGARVEKLVGLIAQGLAFHHWGVVLSSDSFVGVHSLTKVGESYFERMGKLNAKQRAEGNIGDGALIYKGAQGVDNPTISVWEIALYGGLMMAANGGKDFTSKFGVMTGPKTVKDRADERVKRGAFIRLP